MSMNEKLASICSRHEKLAEMMAAGNLSGEEYTKLSVEYAELDSVVGVIKEYQKAVQERDDLEVLMDDPEMKEMATEDFYKLEKRIPELEHQIQVALIPKDEDDVKNAILEIRAGTGGDEAALFAADLFGMYEGFAEKMKWKLEVMEASENDLGGYKEIIAEVRGNNVFQNLKYESGVHRVQRIPKTESGGRIHTSAATVAVLPEAEDVDIEMNESDLRIDVFRASGPGGQSVNTTDSAVRITHIPTGITVSMQDEKSQHKNRAKALKILKTRIYDYERQKAQDERSANRKSQVGSGDRSERIRTYNYPQGRVSDHRINLTLQKLPTIITGEGLGEVIDALIAEDNAAVMSTIDE